MARAIRSSRSFCSQRNRIAAKDGGVLYCVTAKRSGRHRPLSLLLHICLHFKELRVIDGLHNILLTTRHFWLLSRTSSRLGRTLPVGIVGTNARCQSTGVVFAWFGCGLLQSCQRCRSHRLPVVSPYCRLHGIEAFVPLIARRTATPEAGMM